MNLTVTTLW